MLLSGSGRLRETILLLAAALAAFGASLAGTFHLDDYALLIDPALSSAASWRECWRIEQTRPLTWFTFRLNLQLGGAAPAGWHAVSLVLHLAAVVLAYRCLVRLIPPRAALLAALVFGVHPIQAEAVNYVFARATLLMSVACLASLLCWLAERRWAAVALFAVALLAKEECAAFPLVLLFLPNPRRGPIAAMLALSLAAGLRVAVVASMTPGSGAAMQAGISPLEYAAAQGPVVLHYLRTVALPFGFSIDPGIHGNAVVSWGVALAAVALAAWRRRTGYWFVAAFLLLLPSSSIFPAGDLAAYRRMYLPMFCLSALAGLGLARINARAAIVLCVALAGLSVHRSLVWRTERDLWEEAVQAAPGKVRPRLQLARAVEPERALVLLEEASRLAPDDPRVAAERGRVYLESRRFAEALSEFGRALALEPSNPRAWFNRGVALRALGQVEAARQDFRRALELEPGFEEARRRLDLLTEK
ncbi:MAG: tetratricopeptide repeat protein [Bryobacteraceae bacterium]